MGAVIFVTIAIAYFLLRNILGSEKLGHRYVFFFTGSLGSGKTYNGVKVALSKYNASVFRWRLEFFKCKIKGEKPPRKPKLYSTIPIFRNGKIVSTKLERGHIFMYKRLRRRSVVFIDELGKIASQWSYDNPLVIDKLTEMVRFYRQYTHGGSMVFTDQASSEIAKQIRCRCGVVFNLDNFRRYMRVLPFYKCDVNVLKVADDSVTNANNIQTLKEGFLFDTNEKKQPYFFGFLPYKLLSKPHYDTYAYDQMYTAKYGAESLHEDMKVHDFIDITPTPTELDEIKEKKKGVANKNVWKL